MNKIICCALALGMAATLSAAPKKKAPKDSVGFVFTDVALVKTTPVKNQNKSGTDAIRVTSCPLPCCAAAILWK